MPLLEPDVLQIAPEPGEPAPDRAPDWVAQGTPEPLRSQLIDLLGEDRVMSRATDIIRYASDASPYRMLPKAVIMARSDEDIGKVIAFGREHGIGVTFRSGGSSLNGQSQSEGILVDVRRHFGGIKVLDEGRAVSVAPGAMLGDVNRVLAPYGHKLGPDPASVEIATIGGVVANNSGGMKCGTKFDSYSTVTAMRFILPSGTVVDSGAPDAEADFAEAEPELAAGLLKIREEILADEELTAKIRRKFEIKNTTGYRLCAFLDAETPVEIYRRLMVGSEGTLGFISRVTFDTVPVPEKTTLAWIHFPDIPSAIDPVPDLTAAGATAVEVMVAPALIVASYNMPGAPDHWKELDPDSAALLVEFGGDDDEALDRYEKKTMEMLDGRELIREVEFSRDADVIEINWRVREGLYGLVGKMRVPGTTLIPEDICVTPARIAEGAEDLRSLLAEHGFLNGVAGHASAGNLHFMLTPDFGKPEDIERYEVFMGELVELICHKYEGSLKAEHGTGVNMAPYVELEWGEKATAMMWRVKELADPEGALNPGVVLNRDPGCHLQNLMTTPPIEEVATACMECGFCEPVCPSRNLSTTPRQRIVLRREMVRQGGDTPVRRALIEEFEYDGIETCANDGSCELVCPVGIDTGDLMKEFRQAQKSPRAQKNALRVAGNWDKVERLARGGLKFGSAMDRVIGERGMRSLTGAARRVLSKDLTPDWAGHMPDSAPARLPETAPVGATAVYMPACINRMFGRSTTGKNGDGGELSLPEALVAVSARAGSPVWIPHDVAGSCCSVPFSSKGYSDAHAFKANETVERLWRWTGGGALPVVIDATSCSYGLSDFEDGVLSGDNQARHGEIEIIDSISWAERLLENLEVTKKTGSVTVHPTCSGNHMGLNRTLARVAGKLSDNVVVPVNSTCCGFAGDRGMLHPELTASATEAEAAEVRANPTVRHVSSNRTCEVGLERATGEPYESIIYLLEEATR
jgi:D-lactate dehydrogenase